MTQQTTDLLQFFEIPKPAEAQSEESKTSKPNLAKVDGLSRGFYMSVMGNQGGMGTMFGTALAFTKLAAVSILNHMDEDAFDKAKQTLVTQLQLLTDTIKGLSQQQAKVEFGKFEAAVKAMVAKAKDAPKGALSDAYAGTPGEAAAPTSPKSEAELEAEAAEKDLADQLTGALNPAKKKDDIVH